MRIFRLSSEAGMYSFASFQPVSSLKDWWRLTPGPAEARPADTRPAEVSAAAAEQLTLIQELFILPALLRLIKTAQKPMTGVLLDPELGLSALTKTTVKSGLLLPVLSQQSAEVDPLAVPHVSQQWSLPEIANNYGVAVLTLYYHPEEENALRKKQLVAELTDYARYEGIDFLLDLVVYTPAGEEFSLERFQAAQLQAVQELRNQVQGFMLQYPLDPLACATLTTELDVPWLVHSRGLRYDEFKETLRTSLEGGAQGGVLHELAWPAVLPDEARLQEAWRRFQKNPEAGRSELAAVAADWLEKFENQLQTTIRDQLLEVRRIVDEFGG